MFDIGWSELLLVGVVALIVIGPKDLPVVMRTLGRWIRRLRQMAGKVQHQMDEIIREAELEDVRDQLKAARPKNFVKSLDRAIDPDGSIAASFSGRPTDVAKKALAPKPDAGAVSSAPTGSSVATSTSVSTNASAETSANMWSAPSAGSARPGASPPSDPAS